MLYLEGWSSRSGYFALCDLNGDVVNTLYEPVSFFQVHMYVKVIIPDEVHDCTGVVDRLGS